MFILFINAAGCQSEQKKHLTEKDKHIQNTVDAMQTDMRCMDTNITTCTVTSNTNKEDAKDKYLHASLEPIDAAIISEKEDMLRSTGSHPEKKCDVSTTVDPCSTEVKTTCSQKTKCAQHNGKTKSTNISPGEDVPNPLLQDVQGLLSADVLALPSTSERDIIGKTKNEESFNDAPKPPVNKEGVSDTAEAVILKQSDLTPDTYLSSSDAIITNSKQHKSYGRQAKNKYPVTSSVTHPLSPVAQVCTSGNNSSLSSFAEKGLLRMTTDETSVKDKFTPSVEKENGALMGSECASSDESCISPDFRSNSVVMESISNWHKETETKKREFLDSHCTLVCDPAATSPSLSGAVILDLAGMKTVDGSTENAVLNLDREDSGTTKSSDAIPRTQSTITFHVASNSQQATEYISIPTEVAQEKERSKNLSFSLCDIVLVHNGSSDAALQIMDGSISSNSVKGSASEEVQKGSASRDKEVNHAVHEQDTSDDAVALFNEDLADEVDKVPEASGISAEVNLKAFSSPIRGVIHDFTSLAEPDEKNLLNSFKKDEVSFSFQTAEKLLTNESSGNQSEKACSGVGSNNVLLYTGKNDNLDSMSSCTVNGVTNSLQDEVYSLSTSHGTGNNFTSDLVNFQDEKSEAVILQPERNLASRRRKKLLVLDLNGLLADIFVDIRNVHKAPKKVGGKSGEFSVFIIYISASDYPMIQISMLMEPSSFHQFIKGHSVMIF